MYMESPVLHEVDDVKDVLVLQRRHEVRLALEAQRRTGESMAMDRLERLDGDERPSGSCTAL
jgi:hypothetical protein